MRKDPPFYIQPSVMEEAGINLKEMMTFSATALATIDCYSFNNFKFRRFPS